MSNDKNCPNCGAIYELEKNKCPYCGTSYFDMSTIDFDKCEPFYLKMKTRINGKTAYITQLVFPSNARIDYSMNYESQFSMLESGNINSYNPYMNNLATIEFQCVKRNGFETLIEYEDD